MHRFPVRICNRVYLRILFSSMSSTPYEMQSTEYPHVRTSYARPAGNRIIPDPTFYLTDKSQVNYSTLSVSIGLWVYYFGFFHLPRMNSGAGEAVGLYCENARHVRFIRFTYANVLTPCICTARLGNSGWRMIHRLWSFA